MLELVDSPEDRFSRVAAQNLYDAFLCFGVLVQMCAYSDKKYLIIKRHDL